MITIQRILFMKNVPLFSTMPPDTLAWVAEAADEEKAKKRRNFFSPRPRRNRNGVGYLHWVW